MQKLNSLLIILPIIFACGLFTKADGEGGINFIGHAPIPGAFVYDVWGYEDSLTGKYYAITGAALGLSIFDVTDPAEPILIKYMEGIPGFDMKVWKNYLYSVTGGPGINQGKIIDISIPDSPLVVSSFNSAHNIFISENGFLFAEVPGLIIYDLNQDPLNPVEVWRDGGEGGHDAAVLGNRVYDFHGRSGTFIYDIVSYDPFEMELLGTISIPLISYHHSGWVTEDGNYLFICDELARDPSPDITVWEISDPSDPQLVGSYRDSTATVHNLYIIGNYAYTSYYTSGFKVFDVSDPAMPMVAGHYDTSPASGEGFDGAFGCYPFASNGYIYISDQTGLYIFTFDPALVSNEDENHLPVNFGLAQNFPNPFNPTTKIRYSVASSQLTVLKVYDVLGVEIVTLVNEEKSPGEYEVDFNGSSFPSGIYFYSLSSGSFIQTKKMLLIK
jgi:choice-of-anchor B domain-containing protein